jgi:dTDP-4-dehydrorhamnose 3,5-epimerase-like enzyme
MTEYFKEFKVSKVEETNGSSLEFFQDFTFETKRVFFVTAAEQGEVRGRHAHKKCKQLIYSVKGNFEITLKLKNGSTIYKNNLCENKSAILVLPHVWVELKALENNSTFFCLCDRNYEESDYIKQPNTFFDCV